ncbi:enoyl-CoA hydratase/isomerase family protein [Nocardioides yefusunii]|uniref:Enoyl-CoA hydratase/isomerase family protein n=1 Tax=Nocardioides yefusunii TaxID=2500546 RepID=A0ABW1QWR4_9ACTN|nr:enoyl-CoA hydratase/isomerase family protein [Nocardioides yefusunii]
MAGEYVLPDELPAGYVVGEHDLGPEDDVTYAVRDGVAHITLNRPSAANALDVGLSHALRLAAERAASDESAKSVLVSGSGARFCGGGDVPAFAAAEDKPAFLHQLALDADAAVRGLESLEKPVVAAVHGAVAGAGLAIMLAADVIVAAQQTKFVFAYPGIGLTPDCGVSYLLPRAIGQQRALGFALANKPVTAATAHEWGMVTEVVHDADVAVSRATQVALDFAAGPASALGQARRLLRAGWEIDRTAVGVEEARTISRAVAGAEAVRLIERFVAR